jgi:methyl-accepting chemotaxis protein
MNLRAKIIVFTSCIVSIAIGSIIFANNRNCIKAYTEILHSRTLAVGNSLKIQLDRLLQLGIRIENLTGFDEQCLEIVNVYEGIQYAMVADSQSGRILFHNDLSLQGTALKEAALLNAIKSDEKNVVRSFTEDGGEIHSVIIPVFDMQGRHIAAVGVGFPGEIISAKKREMNIFSIKAGVFFLICADVTLLLTLSVFMTKPLTRLLAVIEEMKEKKEVYTRSVDICSNDEIGQVASAFNMMTECLRNATVSKVAYEH